MPAVAVRVGFPEANALSHQAWVGERAAATLPLVIETVGKRCEPFTTLLIFLAGSALHGELCGITIPDGRRRYLSDIDVGILTRWRVPASDQGEIARAAASTAGEAPEPRLGFYCEEDLSRQDPTLGLVEGVRHGIVVRGDAAQLSRFRVPALRAIPAAEARRLLANRVLEWLACRVAGEADPGPTYAACKLVADLAAVSLLARGAYRGGGYRERARMARELACLDAPAQAQVDAWTEWRLLPRWDLTPVGTAVDDGRAPELLSARVREATREGLRICSGDVDIGRFLRGIDPGPRVRARSWKRWTASRPGRILGLRPANWLHSPRGLLWGAAIACALDDEAMTAQWLSRLGAAREFEAAPDAERIVAIARSMEREGID